jgi:cysteine sulfinate desulfinase/cysteine desulfurase-like protein
MRPAHQSRADIAVHRVLTAMLADLRKSERLLTTSIDNTAPNSEREAFLAAIRVAIAKLQRIFASQN